MRQVVIVAVGLSALAIASCSKAPEAPDQDQIVSSDRAPLSSPGIAVTAAPGVAFNYQYSFRLPAAAIAAAQEAHAQACEKLGIARCRITGMRYRLIGENDVEAMLAVTLDPAIARAFGKNGIGLIEAAKGSLVDAEITGTDAAAAIKRSTTTRVQATSDLDRTDTQLARKDLPTAERAELQAERADLARQSGAAASEAAGSRDSLATTPMTFSYGSGAAVRGFDASAPLTSALDTVIVSAQTTIAVLLGILAIFGPPAVALLMVWLAWRRLGGPVRAAIAKRRKTSEA